MLTHCQLHLSFCEVPLFCVVVFLWETKRKTIIFGGGPLKIDTAKSLLLPPPCFDRRAPGFETAEPKAVRDLPWAGPCPTPGVRDRLELGRNGLEPLRVDPTFFATQRATSDNPPNGGIFMNFSGGVGPSKSGGVIITLLEERVNES